MGVPFFSFDTRFERNGEKDGSLISLFGTDLAQWHGLKDWLRENKQANVLVLASGSPLCPIRKHIVKYPQLANELDNLLAYPDFLAGIVDQISNVCPESRIIWLAGDPHFSSIAILTLRAADKCINVTSITASGLYATMPFANASTHEYCWDKPQSIELKGQTNVQMEFCQQLLSDSYQQFSKLEIELESKIINITSYDADGMPLCPTKTIKPEILSG